jgi:hypothetical protein
MPHFVRSVSATRALILAAWCFGAAAPAAAQDAHGSVARSASALVVVLSARDSAVRSSRIANALGGREVVSIYTTDAPVAYQFAAAVHTAFGGSLIPYDRRSRAADEFASLLVQNAVEHAARQHPGQAVLVVVEPDLVLPFLRRATGKPTTGVEPEDIAADGFTITITSNGDRTATRLPF